MKKRLKAGLFIDFDIYYNTELCRGAKEACDELGIDLIIFFGGTLGYNRESRNTDTEHQKTIVYEYANEMDIDFIIMPTTGICQFSKKIQESFVQYFNKPVISLNTPYDGYSSIVFDNYSGIKETVSYMIDYCHRKHIGMITGFKGNFGSENRVNGYKDALLEHDIPLNQDNILYCPDYSFYNTPYIGKYLDAHKDLDAIMCATDTLAICLYEELNKRNITIGKDIIVCGFDDSIQGSSLVPPLSSIHADAAVLSYSAVMSAYEQLQTQKTFTKLLPTTLIKRMSTGEVMQDEDQLYFFIRNCVETHLDYDYIASGIIEFIFLNRIPFSNNIKELTHDLLYYIISIENKDIHDPLITTKLLEKMELVFTIDNIDFLDLDRFLSSLSIIQDIMVSLDRAHDEKERSFYRYVYSQSVHCFNSILSKQTLDHKQQLFLINSINKDTMSLEDDGNLNKTLSKDLLKMNVKNAMIFTYNDKKTYQNDFKFRIDTTLSLLIHIKNGEIISTPAKEYLVNDILDSIDLNYSIMNSIYFNENQYGIMISDISYNQLSQLEYLSSQFGNVFYAFDHMNSLKEISVTDELTQLYNRRGLLKEIKKLDHNNKDMIHYILLADLDGLKKINDQYGHDHGDKAILAAKEILQEVFKHDACISRIGGDEFLVLFSHITTIEIKNLSHEIHQATKRINELYQYPYEVSLSYGVSVYDKNDADTIENIIMNADKLMYERKRKHKQK